MTLEVTPMVLKLQCVSDSPEDLFKHPVLGLFPPAFLRQVAWRGAW